MKRHLVYLLTFLCFALVGCKDDENKDDGRIYPEEPQTPFQVSNRKGRLVHLRNEWEIYAYSEPDGRLLDTVYCIKDMPEDFQPQAYRDVDFSGEAIYLYYKKMISGEVTCYYSLNVSEMSYSTQIPK